MTKNPWVVKGTEKKYKNAWIEVNEFNVINPSGKPGIYGTVSFNNLAIGIIPLDTNGFTWLVGQWRFPLDAYSWEIPEGGGPLHQDPLTSAKRELKEETGLIAHSWTELSRLHTSNSVCDELGILYLAHTLEYGTAEPEETELLDIKKVHLNDAFEMVMKGEITDSLSQIGILKAKIWYDNKINTR